MRASQVELHEPDSRPVLLNGPVLEAARASLQPPGPLRWSIESRTDCIELRVVVRRWSTTAHPTAQLARIACGSALRAARLAVAVQGRRPLVSYPEQPGLLAVLYPGLAAPPRRSDVLLHRLLRHEVVPAWYRARLLDPPTAFRRLRCAVEGEGAWVQVLDGLPPAADLGPRWQDADDRAPAADRRTLVALVGAPGRQQVADLRVGQALETLRLTAMVLGLEMDVLAAPARPIAGLPRRVGSGTETLAVVRFGWPPAEVRYGQDEGHGVEGTSDAAAVPGESRESSSEPGFVHELKSR